MCVRKTNGPLINQSTKTYQLAPGRNASISDALRGIGIVNCTPTTIADSFYPPCVYTQFGVNIVVCLLGQQTGQQTSQTRAPEFSRLKRMPRQPTMRHRTPSPSDNYCVLGQRAHNSFQTSCGAEAVTQSPQRPSDAGSSICQPFFDAARTSVHRMSILIAKKPHTHVLAHTPAHRNSAEHNSVVTT